NGAREPIAVFLLDDHEVVRRGVRDLLEAEPDIKVIGEAGTASSALARIPALKPDVAVLGVRVARRDGGGGGGGGEPRVPGGAWRSSMGGCPTATGCRCAGRSAPGCPRWPA